MNDPHRERCDEVIRKIRDLAGERCEHFFFIGSVPDEDGELRTIHTWDGPFNAAIGLVERAKERLRQSMIDCDSPSPDDDSDDWKAGV